MLDYFLDFLWILKTSGHCYGGGLFSMILFIFFSLCNNHSLAALIVQFKNKHCTALLCPLQLLKIIFSSRQVMDTVLKFWLTPVTFSVLLPVFSVSCHASAPGWSRYTAQLTKHPWHRYTPSQRWALPKEFWYSDSYQTKTAIVISD